MSKPVKVFNKGKRPVVFKRDRTGTDAIHPGKFLLFDPEKAKDIIKKFNDACSEEDFDKILEEASKTREEDRKKAKEESLKKAKKKEAARKKTEAEEK